MVSVNQVLIIAGVIVGAFVALIIVAGLGFLVHRAIKTIEAAVKQFSAAAANIENSATSFRASLDKTNATLDELGKRTTTATNGHSEIAKAMVLEYKKLQIAIQTFSGMIMKPDITTENLKKFGLQTPGDQEADRQFDIEQLVSQGLPYKDAEDKVNSDLELNAKFNMGMD